MVSFIEHTPSVRCPCPTNVFFITPRLTVIFSRKQRKREQNRAKKTQGGAKSGSKYHATAKVLPVEETRALGASDGDDASKGPSKGAMVGEGEPGMMEAGGVVEGAKETGVLSVRGASQENNR